jgi:hypothetical protein
LYPFQNAVLSELCRKIVRCSRMIAELDIWRLAHILVVQRGPSAWSIAADRFKAASIAGDQERASAWLRIANAISEFAARGVSRTVH